MHVWIGIKTATDETYIDESVIVVAATQERAEQLLTEKLGPYWEKIPNKAVGTVYTYYDESMTASIGRYEVQE